VQGCVATGGERAVWTYIKHKRAYGVLTNKAFAVDAMAVRRAAAEKNFIVSLYDEGFDEWEGGGNELWPDCRHASFIYFIITPAKLRDNNSRDP